VAEWTDRQVETRLRDALHGAAAALPLTVRPDDVLRHRAERRPVPAAGARSLRLLALAAALLVPLAAMVALGQRPDQPGRGGDRTGHAATTLADGRVLITGGATDPSDLAADLYDPQTGTFTATGRMNEPRDGHTATLLEDGRVLVVGGSTEPSAEIYDPTSGTFRRAGSPSAPRYGHGAALLPDGSVLIVGGSMPSEGQHPSTPAVEIYDPSTDAFHALSSDDPLLDRVWPTVVALPDGRVVIAGGRDPRARWPLGQGTNIVFDARSGTVEPLPSRSADGWVQGAAAMPDGRIAIVEGTRSPVEGTDPPPTVSILDPTTGEVEPLTELPGVFAYLPVPPPVVLADGRLLVLLGDEELSASAGRTTQVAHLVDVKSGSSTKAGSMVHRLQRTVTALPDGGALILGGVTVVGEYAADADADDVDQVVRLPAPAPVSDPARFIAQRNAICVAGSGDISDMNDTMDPMSPPELADAFHRIAARIRSAQAELDRLAVPPELADFVTADNARRARRIELVEQLAVAVVEDPDAVEAIDAELTAVNVQTERAEDASGTYHCP
jgi:hypothetical protein